MIPPMPTAAADWVYDVVLTQRYKESVGAIMWTGAREKRRDEGQGAAFVRTCACQYGPCGYCSAGRHDRCTHLSWRPAPSCTTYLQAADGIALAEVWRTGTPCVWSCACDCRTVVPIAAAVLPWSRGEQLGLFELAGGAR